MRKKPISSMFKAYLAGFLDGDGSIYVRAKPNHTYKYDFQIAPYIVFFQSAKSRESFGKLCALIGLGHIRERKDGILEYIISKHDNVQKFLSFVESYVVLKKPQVKLMLNILEAKAKVKNARDFRKLLRLVDSFRKLNYSKNRKVRILTP